MVGLTILAVVAAYIAVVWWLVRFALKNNWTRAAVILAALAIPFWDLPFGYYNYLNHCDKEGGIRIAESFSPQRSIYFVTPTGYRPELLLRWGYEKVEYKNTSTGAIERFFKDTNGILRRSEASTAGSTLRLRSDYNTKLDWNLYRQQELLEHITEGRVIAQATKLIWLGGWLHQLLALGPAATCHSESLNEIVRLAPQGSLKTR